MARKTFSLWLLVLLFIMANHRSIRGYDGFEALPGNESLEAMGALEEAIPLAVTYYDPISTSEVLGFLWTVQLLIFKEKNGRSDVSNTTEKDQVSTLLLPGV